MPSSGRVRHALLVAILLVLPVPAQITGTFTIDSTIPTSGTNFANFADAIAALTAGGVSGPCVFDVYNGTGPYTGFAIAGPVAGASAANNIVFRAAALNAPVISGPAGTNLQTIKLGTANTAGSGPSFITIQGFLVQGAPAGAPILAAGCNSIVIRQCIAQNCGGGISLTQSPNSVVEDCEVNACGMTPGAPGLATYAGGIALTDRSDFCVVQRNRVHDCTGNGIFLGGAGSATAQVRNNIVINNFVWNCPGSGSYPGGIALRRVTDSIVSNNSISMPAGSVNNGLHIMASVLTVVPPVGAAQEVSNNIVRHAGTGGCVAFDVTSAVVPNVFDYNLYDAAGGGPVGKVGAVLYATLAAWQANAAPSLAGKEQNSLAGASDYLNPLLDLHILPSSLARLSGSTVASVIDDIDGESRNPIPCRGADELTPPPLFAAFALPPVTTAPAGFGPAAFSVNFLDQSATTDPGGILSWAWDFNGDTVIDSTAQNPSYTYSIPGTYSVSLTVTDAANPPSTLTRTNLITCQPYRFRIITTGGGVGDVFVSPIPNSQVPTATTGYMLISFNTVSVVAGGPLFGIYPDFYSWNTILSPAVAGDVFHWIVVAGLFPNVGFGLPPGALAGLAGLTLDGVQVDVTGAFSIANISTVSRAAF